MQQVSHVGKRRQVRDQEENAKMLGGRVTTLAIDATLEATAFAARKRLSLIFVRHLCGRWFGNQTGEKVAPTAHGPLQRGLLPLNTSKTDCTFAGKKDKNGIDSEKSRLEATARLNRSTGLHCMKQV